MLEDRFVITDRQWLLMEPHCLGKKSDPGRTGGEGRLFLELVLAARGVIYRPDLAIGTACSSASAIGSKPVFSNAFSMPCRMSPTWSSP